MMNINLQLFAHKKGGGSTKNGRDSESKRLGPKRADYKNTEHYIVTKQFLDNPERMLKYLLEE